MLRPFRLQTLSGNAQPLFGDVTTAAIPLALPASGAVVVPVADSTLYQAGDRIILNFGQTKNNVLLVDSLPSATSLLCQLEGNAPWNGPYTTAAVIALAIAAMKITVQAVQGSVNPIWIGTDKSITSAGAGNAVAQVVAGNPYNMAESSGWNSLRTSDAWMAAIATTQGIVSAVIA